MGSEWALARDRPHFHPRSVIEARHALCDRRRLLEAVRGQQQVAADDQSLKQALMSHPKVPVSELLVGSALELIADLLPDLSGSVNAYIR
jgi:hypothetical protein